MGLKTNRLKQYEDVINGTGTAATAQDQSALSDQEALARIRRDAEQQQAWVSYQRMMKYLPQINKQLGMNGLGVSESGQIEAANNLSNQLANADYNYASRMNQYRYADEQQKKSEAAAKSSALMEQALGLIGSTTSQEDVNRIMNAYRGLLTDSDRDVLETYVNQAVTNNPQAQSLFEQYALAAKGYNNAGARFLSNKDNKGLTAGDNFRLTDASGNTYKIESGGEVDDEEIIKVAGKHNDGDVFGYGGKLYLVKDGKVYLVQKRKNSESKSYQNLYNLYFGQL